MNKILRLIEETCLDYKFKKSKEQEIYYIQINWGLSGFFAILRGVLNYCCYADENGFIPYIKYGRETLYSENGFFLGTNNPFEYYYEQPITLNSSSWIVGINLIKNKSAHADSIELKYNLKPLSYLIEDTYIERMSGIYRKYMHLNETTKRIIEKSIENILKGKRTLGVHIRGTDFYKEFNNHPVPVTVDEYINVINDEIQKREYEQVFVATDDIRCLKELKNKLQVPLVYYRNIKRTDNNKSVAFERSGRKNHNYLLGIEVLKDVYTLVACDGFVGCLSQIDTFVQIIKKSKEQEFISLKIINKGIFSNNRQCWEPTK